MLRTDGDERQVKLVFVEYADRLARAMDLAKIGRAELANGIGVSVQAIGQVLKGDTKALSASNNAKAARFMRVDSYWLATGEGLPETSQRDALSAAAVAVGAVYDRMNHAQQDNFVKLLEVAFGASERERPKELGHSDMMDLDIDLTDKQAERRSKRGTSS